MCNISYDRVKLTVTYELLGVHMCLVNCKFSDYLCLSYLLMIMEMLCSGD